MTNQSRGHRLVAHTADLIIEAWGPDLATCCEEAAAGLISTFATETDAGAAVEQHIHLPAGAPDALLVDLLEEIIFTLDTDERVPVRVAVGRAGDGGLDVVLSLVDRATVAEAGAVPKAISRSGLQLRATDRGVECRVLVDV